MRKFTILLIFLSTIFLFSCHVPNQKLKNRMIEKYSDDESYVSLSGIINKIEGNNVTIKCEMLSEYITYEDYSCDYYIYSNQIINIMEGASVEFITCPYHFYNGHLLPIVELKINGVILLNFDEGKNNLINSIKNSWWIKSVLYKLIDIFNVR